ncbi:MAG TPA: hypothetical protein VJ870_18990 [Amycolatopsis sp.]|nr:hypothetical protein [Amycolatopsis sp.]
MTLPEPATCTRCGARRDLDADATAALTWVSERAGDTTRWLCPACARDHVRDIEGKLPEDYW